MTTTELMIAANSAKLDGYPHLAAAFETLLRQQLKREGKL